MKYNMKKGRLSKQTIIFLFTFLLKKKKKVIIPLKWMPFLPFIAAREACRCFDAVLG